MASGAAGVRHLARLGVLLVARGARRLIQLAFVMLRAPMARRACGVGDRTVPWSRSRELDQISRSKGARGRRRTRLVAAASAVARPALLFDEGVRWRDMALRPNEAVRRQDGPGHGQPGCDQGSPRESPSPRSMRMWLFEVFP